MKRDLCLLLLLILYSTLSCRLFQMQPMEVEEWSPSAKTVASTDDVHIWLTFSSPVDRTRVEEAFSLTENGENMEGSFSWKNETLIFKPFKPFSRGVTYVVRVTTQAEDIYGNSLPEDFFNRFKIGIDDVSPAIATVLPTHNSVTDNLFEEITMHFSEAVDAGSLYSAFSISPNVQGCFSWPDDSTAVFTPMAAYEWQEEYEVSLANTLEDLEGNRLTEPFTWRFKTGSDTTPPAVTFAGSIDESYTLTAYDNTTAIINEEWESYWGIKIIFSEEVDRVSLQNVLSVEPGWSFQIEWPDPLTTDQVLLIPNERFSYGELYTLRLGDELSDCYGNQTSSEISYRFLVNGPESFPPEITRFTYMSVPGSADSGDITELSSFDLIDLSNYDTAAEGFFDIYLHLAEGASINLMSFMESLSIDCTNQCADISPIALEQSAAAVLSPDPNPAPDTNINEVVVRIYAVIDNDPGKNGVITAGLAPGLKDSRENALAGVWEIILIK